MFEFNDNKPIYRQIVEYAFNHILDGSWVPGEMIPSVRELTYDLSVNSRTVLKALEELQDHNVVEPKRGMGFLLTHDAKEKVMHTRRQEFFDRTIPSMIAEMKILGITTTEIIQILTDKTQPK